MQPITSLGLAELTQDEMVEVVGGDGCWCSSLVRAIGYGLGYAAGEIVDALIRPSDSNSFLLK
ncbi:MAG: hypothetical protein ACT4PJ_17415 [Gemmatimonadaceae bacterium]